MLKVFYQDQLVRTVTNQQAQKLINHAAADLHLTPEPHLTIIRPDWKSVLRIGQRQYSSRPYNNLAVLGPDNQLMFRGKASKIIWYLDHHLAEIVDDQTIKLNFTTNGPGHSDHHYDTNIRHNYCVSCGSTQKLTRHHIIPYCYRRYIPKSKLASFYHDIVTLCLDCHTIYEKHAQDLKQELAQHYNAPLTHSKPHQTEHLSNRLARTILKHGNTLPTHVLARHQQLLHNLLGHSPNKEELQELAKHKAKNINPKHGQTVINNCPDLQALAERWRQHFLNILNPQHLPTNWSPNTKFINQ